MNRIEIKAGYHEWNVFVDGEHFFTFDDVSENIPSSCTLDDLKNVVKNCVSCMNTALVDDEKEPFPTELEAELKEKMINAWSCYCDTAKDEAKGGEADCLPCGMHPNACPCGDGACADYIP